MAWPQRTYRDAPQDVLTGAPVVTAEPSAQQLASRVVGGAARATGGRPANDPDWWRQLAAALGCFAVVFVVGLWVKGQGPQELGSFSGVLHSFGRSRRNVTTGRSFNASPKGPIWSLGT